MNRDLENSLEELGPSYRAVVARLKAGREAESVDDGLLRLRSFRWFGLVAASLLLTMGFVAVLHIPPQTSSFQPPASNVRIPSHAPREYRFSAEEMIATQNPDGSWANDFLTRRNARALANCDSLAARIACKRALRNLRMRGIL